MFEEFVNEKLTPMVDKLVSDKVLPLDERIDDIVQGVEIMTDVIAEMPKKLQDEVSKLDDKISKLKLKNGKDGKDGKNGLNGKDGQDGLDGADGLDGSPDTPKDIKDKLESLKGDARLDKKAIKGLEDIMVQADLDRAISILDSRTSFLINKINNLGNTGGGGGGSGPFTGITGTPNRFALFDNSGNGATDNLATRDFLTGETYIGYRTGAGQFTNALHLGNFIGSFITDGVGFQRHDSVNDNYTVSMAIDGTAIGSTSNTILTGYIDNTNGIFSDINIDDIGARVNYTNSVLGVSGKVKVNHINTEISHEASSYTNSIRVRDFIDLKVDNTLGRNLLRLNGDYIRGNRSNSSAYFELNTANDTFDIGGTPSSLGFNTRLLHIDTLNATTAMGDVDGNLTNVKFATDLNAGWAYVDGLKTEIPTWTPTFLSDGFTGTGLNDMNYDSTVTYTGTYPNTYTATIVSVGSVYVNIVSIITPGFVTGDTVSDGAGSTGTIIGGSEVDGFFIIAPIVDAGWTSVTTLSDISTGASATVSGAQYVDTFSWSSTDGGSGIIIPTSSVINLGDGLTVGFGSQTGHTLGDLWEWSVSAATVYSKMALFDGANRTMSIGDVDHTKDDVRTDWVLGTGKDTGIYNYISKAREFIVHNDEGVLMALNYQVDNNFELRFGIYNPHSGFSTISSVSNADAYGVGININDTAGDHYVLIGDFSSYGNSTYISVDDDAKNIKFLADGLETNSQDIPITAKVVLNASQLSTFGSVPIEVIPAPGAGRMIQPISAYGEYTHVTTAYANFGIPGLTHEPASGSLPLKFSVALLSQANNYVQFAGTSAEGYNAGFKAGNQPLYFTDDDFSDPTTGDGTLTLYITYKIIEL